MSLAFVFPGQGSQAVGMMSDLAAASPRVSDTFSEASEVLGYDLWRVICAGPRGKLDETEVTQPAMLCAGFATWRVWKEQGGRLPEVLAGHSLGEYTALVCAGALEFATAVDLVRYRARAMQNAVPAGTGAMAAILGLDDEQVAAACAGVSDDTSIVEPVNYNAPGQVVIAGHVAAVERAIDAARAAGARRAVQLPVSVPSHSSLMGPAADALAPRLAATEFTRPQRRVVSSVDLRRYADAAGIRENLVAQVQRPVRWVETVAALTGAEGATAIVECGPGKVLTGLNRRITRGSDCALHALIDMESINATRLALDGEDA